MKKVSPVMVIVFTIISFGFYALFWVINRKTEMNAQGANIPTAWLMIVPVVGIWWSWKFAGGVEHVTRGKTSQVIAFILMAVLGVIGMAIIQDAFNKVADQGALPNARAMG
jgi:hypothetical protein